MTNDKNFYSSDRVQVIQDERERIIVLKDFNLQLPQVGIFDEPTRCYTVNKEWAKIITGAVSLLCEIAVWQDAENEDYAGIRAILDFLEGGDCMTFDCNDVEACLAVSAIIAQLQADIAANTANIAANAVNIANNANDIANLDDRVSDTEISILGINAQITLINDAITILQTDVAQNYILIQNLQQYVNDHETRITALENSGVGGNPPQIKVTVYSPHVDTEQILNGFGFEQFTQTVQAHTFTYENALVLVEFRARSPGGTGTYGYFRLDIAGASSSPNQGIALSSSQQSMQLQDIWYDLQGQTLDIYLSGRQGNAGAAISGNQNLQYLIVEWTTASNVFTSPSLVTFDLGGFPYQLPMGNQGTIEANGNPDNCLAGTNINDQDYVSVEIDLLNPKSITGINADYYLTNENGTRVYLFIDDIEIGNLQPFALNPNEWGNAAFGVPFFPVTGQLIRIEVTNDSGSPMADMRIDNIEISWE